MQDIVVTVILMVVYGIIIAVALSWVRLTIKRLKGHSMNDLRKSNDEPIDFTNLIKEKK